MRPTVTGTRTPFLAMRFVTVLVLGLLRPTALRSTRHGGPESARDLSMFFTGCRPDRNARKLFK